MSRKFDRHQGRNWQAHAFPVSEIKVQQSYVQQAHLNASEQMLTLRRVMGGGKGGSQEYCPCFPVSLVWVRHCPKDLVNFKILSISGKQSSLIGTKMTILPIR